MSFDRERKQNNREEAEAHERSDGMKHERFKSREAQNAPPGYYEPHWEEERAEKKPKEMFHSASSHAEFSVSAAGRGALVISGREKGVPGGPTLRNDRKIFRGKRRRRMLDDSGQMFTSGREADKSAFAYMPTARLPAPRILAELNEYRKRHGQETAARAMPFLTLREDREALAHLGKKADAARAAGMSSVSVLAEKRALSRRIGEKEEMERRFLKTLHRAGMESMHHGEASALRTFISIKEVSETDDGANEEENPEKN